MCDYSLAGIPNRLAAEGEQLFAYRFSTGAIGLTSPDGSRWRLWSKKTPAVCVPPGACLLLRDIPKDLQQQCDVNATEEVIFVQLSAEAYQYGMLLRKCCETGLKRLAGIWLLGSAPPETGSTKRVEREEKSPVRCACVGTNCTCPLGTLRTRVPWWVARICA